jgi:TP901 family phage tail tape measure protein
MANLNIAIKIAAQDQASGVLGRIGGALRGLTGETGVAGRGFAGLQGVVAGLATAGMGLLFTGILAVGGALGGSIGKAAEFQQAMANVGAVSLASADDLGRLEAAALEAGSTTAFTATQSANALSFLAMAGFSVDESITALPAVLAAAAAGNLDLATTADIVSNVLGGMRMEAGEAGRVADVLALASANSNTNIAMLGETMKFAAPAAANWGMSLEEATAAAGFLADAGIQGSLAGTHLRAIMGSLSTPTNAATAALKNLGVQVRGESGEMLGLAEIIGQMEGALGDVTPAQRDFALNAIFGREAAGSFSILLGRGAEELAEYAGELGEASSMFDGLGAAQMQARMQLDTFEGSMTLLRSAVDGAMVSIGSAFLPILQQLALGAIPLVQGALAAVLPIVDGVAAGVRLFGENVQAGMTPLGAFQAMLGGLISPELAVRFGEIVAGVQGFMGTAQAALEPVMAFIANNVQLSDVLGALGIVVASIVLPALAGIVVAAAPVLLMGAALIGGVALLRQAWEGNWGGIQEKTATAVAFVQTTVGAGLAQIQAWWAENGEGVKARVAETWAAVVARFAQGIDNGKALVGAGLAAIRAWWAENGEEVKGTVSRLWTALGAAFSSGLATAKTTVETALANIQTFWANNKEGILSAVGILWDTIKSLFQGGADMVTGIIAAFTSAREGDWRGFGEALRGISETMMAQISTAITGGLNAVLALFGTSIDDIKAKFTGAGWSGVGTAVVQGMADGIRNGAGAIADAARAAAQAALDAAKGLLGIKSPSSRMRNEWARDGVIAGATLGLIENKGRVASAMVEAFNPQPALAMASANLMPSLAVTPSASGTGTGRGRGDGAATATNYYTIEVDARGHGGSVADLEAAVNRAVMKALAAAGVAADQRMRTGFSY